MSDPAVYASAFSSRDSDFERGLPVRNHITFELALARAEEDKIRFHQAEPEREAADRAALSAFSQKGGKAPRENTLNDPGTSPQSPENHCKTIAPATGTPGWARHHGGQM